MLQNERQQHVDSKGRGVYLSMLFLLPHSDMPINVEVRRRSPLLLSFAQNFPQWPSLAPSLVSPPLASRHASVSSQYKGEISWTVCSSLAIHIHPHAFLADLAGHAIAMAAFGYAGYWVHNYEVRTNELIAWKRAELQARADEREARAAAAA